MALISSLDGIICKASLSSSCSCGSKKSSCEAARGEQSEANRFQKNSRVLNLVLAIKPDARVILNSCNEIVATPLFNIEMEELRVGITLLQPFD